MKPVKFVGSSLDDLRALPDDAKREAGYQLDFVQRGKDPKDWKPMPSIGSGVREIRIRITAGAFRVVYVATFADTVYVLHVFQKKSQRTLARDINLAKARFKFLLRRPSE